MRNTALVLTLLVAAFACALDAGRAFAQPARVFVAAQGSDANPCSFAQPCRTFQHAHDVVSAGGEIDVLDPAGYGAVTITKSISIQGHGFAGISAPNGTAVTVNAASSDRISLNGLLIDGVGAGNNGIELAASASALEVRQCLVRRFTGAGLMLQPAVTFVRIAVSDSYFVGNAIGMNVQALAIGSFVRVLVQNNSGIGVQFQASGNYTVSDSDVSNNGSEGVKSSAGSVLLRDLSVTNNGTGVSAANVGTVVRMTRLSITGNGQGLSVASSGQIVSFGDNSLAGNTIDGTPTSTIVLK